MDVSRVKDWNEVRRLIFTSYSLIAPRKSLDKFEGKVIRIEKDGRRPARRRPSRKT